MHAPREAEVRPKLACAITASKGHTIATSFSSRSRAGVAPMTSGSTALCCANCKVLPLRDVALAIQFSECQSWQSFLLYRSNSYLQSYHCLGKALPQPAALVPAS